MKLLTLPSVPPSATLRQAFDAMQRASRSAVIAKIGGEYRLFSASHIVISMAEHAAQTLADLPDWVVLHVPRRMDLLGGIVAGLPLDRGVLENALDHVGQQFGILAQIDDEALMMTRHEDGGEPWEPAPSSCYCRIDGKAVGIPPGYNQGPCPHQSYHGNSVRCVP